MDFEPTDFLKQTNFWFALEISECQCFWVKFAKFQFQVKSENFPSLFIFDSYRYLLAASSLSGGADVIGLKSCREKVLPRLSKPVPANGISALKTSASPSY
jgi:hypothetical protein